MATTTAEVIRDRAIAVITALTPAIDPIVRFESYRNEGGADFQPWAETYAPGCRRRFQVRTTGASVTPAVSNTDIEEHQVTLTVTVAYPQTGRDGAAQALDRDDTLDADAFQIDRAIGMLGVVNGTWTTDATWLSGGVSERIVGTSVDFLVLVYVYFYKRTR